jgi:DNA-directed RNA polymerase subunit RPC12/RpoP
MRLDKPNLECYACNHEFYRSPKKMVEIYANGDDIPCPKCGSYSVEPIIEARRTFEQIHKETFNQQRSVL